MNKKLHHMHEEEQEHKIFFDFRSKEQIQKNLSENKNIKEDDLKLIETFEKLKYYWKWIMLSLFLTLFFAFIYLRYTSDQYLVKSSIFINDSENGGLNTQQDAFRDLGVYRNATEGSVYNEASILKTYSSTESVVKELKLNVCYYLKGKVTNGQIYGSEVPIKVNFFISDSVFYKLNTLITVTPKSKSEYYFSNSENTFVKNVKFGDEVITEFGSIIISLSGNREISIGETIIIKILPLQEVVQDYNERIKINVESDNSSIINLSLIDEIKEKAIDILNVLVTQYINQSIEYRKDISEKTDEFINDRIMDVYEDLYTVDVDVETFKVKNKLTDLTVEAGIDLSANSEIQTRIIEINSQIKLVEYILEYLKNNQESLIPTNLGLSDAGINENTNNYNILLMERNKIIRNSSKLNPVVVNLDSQIANLRKSIEQSLINLKSSLLFSLNEAKNYEYSVNSKRVAAPKQEREFQDFKRKQQIIESLYLYLLQKREENVITLGMPLPNAKIIDKAHGDDKPVFPKPHIIYLISGLIGLMIPVGILSLKSLFDNKVHSYKDVQSIVRAPFLGEIPRSDSKSKLVISRANNSIIGESFRLLRTNVEFMLSDICEGPRTIFITSTIGSEGKTFIAINLAASLAVLNKKVLLVGADIRKPKIGPYIGINPNKGLTDFLSDKNVFLDNIIFKDKDYGFDIIDSGVIPPNPTELLLNGRFKDIINYGKEHYDYVIIDTAPVNVVTDTLLLGHFADLFIYVIRAELLDKRQLEVPKIMHENNRLPNMTILINSINTKKRGYGYGYGYGNGYGYSDKDRKRT